MEFGVLGSGVRMTITPLFSCSRFSFLLLTLPLIEYVPLELKAGADAEDPSDATVHATIAKLIR